MGHLMLQYWVIRGQGQKSKHVVQQFSTFQIIYNIKVKHIQQKYAESYQEHEASQKLNFL